MVLSDTRLSSRCHALSGTAAHVVDRTHIANHRRKHDGNDEHWIPRLMAQLEALEKQI